MFAGSAGGCKRPCAQVLHKFRTPWMCDKVLLTVTGHPAHMLGTLMPRLPPPLAATLAAALALVLCAACNGPGPAMLWAQAHEVEVDGSRFRVFHQGARAEAVRLNFEFPASAPRIFPKAAIAMERATECRAIPATMTGDAALIRAVLDCGTW